MIQTKLWAIQGSKLTKMKINLQHKSLFNIAKLYSCTQPSSGWPMFYQGLRLLVRLATELDKSSEQKQST